MNLINCIAIDDEPLALEKMEQFISKVSYLQLQATFSNCLDALEYLKENPTQLIFLDIEMDDLNGLQFISLLPIKPLIILTTAYDNYALKAFDMEVTDYLLKPFSFERFFKASERASAILNSVKIEKQQATKAERDFFFVQADYKLQKVYPDDILYVEGLKEYIIIYTSEKKIITLLRFEDILKRLSEQRFIRIHKSYIIAIDKIDCIDKNHVVIGEKSIPIGRTYKKEFEARLDQFKLKMK